jgi:hypothetical protein
MKTIFKITALITAAAFVLGACAAGQPAPTETQSQTPEATITSTSGETFTPPPSPTTRPTSTRKPSPTPRLTTRPTSTQRPSPTPRPTHAGPTPTAISPEEDSFVTEGTLVPQPDSAISVENAGQLEELARWGYGEINRVIHTADGQLMLVQTDAGVYAFRVGTLDEVWRFQPDEVLTGIKLLEDGDIQVGALRRTLYRLDPSDGSLLETATGNLPEADEHLPGEPLSREESSVDPAVIDAFFEQVEVPEGLPFDGISPNGKYFVFSGWANTVAVYDTSDFSLVLMFDPEDTFGMVSPHNAAPPLTSGPDSDTIISTVFNRSESFLITANGDGQIFFFDLERGDLNIFVHGNGEQLIIPPYGDTVIFYDKDTIEVYGIPSGERIASLNFELGVAWQLIYSPGGTRLAAGTTLWNTADGAFTTMPENERVIGFSENGSYVYSIRQGSWWVERRTDNLVLHQQTSLEIQDTDFFTVGRLKYHFHSEAFWSYDSENNELTAYAAGLYVPTWDTQTGRLVEFPEDDLMPDDIFWAYALSPDGAVRAEFSGNVLMLSDNLSGEILARFNLSPWELARVAFSPDGRYLAVGSRNGVVRIFGVP